MQHQEPPDLRQAILNRLRWETITSLGRALRPYVDPSSYRPLILLAVISLAVFLWPLAVDVAYALFFMIPSWVRRSFAHGLILTLIAAGLVRLCRVREKDQWPIEPPESEPGEDSAAARWMPWALRLAVASLAIPIMTNPDGFGFGDWDFVLDKFEALRRTILIWGQFPWWNPWSRGGFPLAAEPQIGAVSMATPLVLGFGTTIGLRISAILCLLLAVEGTYRLAWLWFREPWASAAASMIYGLNGAVVLASSMGYVLPMSYCSVPWLAYFAFRVGRRFSDGLWLGFWSSFVVMNGIQYMSLYAVPLTASIWLRAFRMQPRGRRRAMILHTLAAIGVFLLICGWRLSTVLLVILDDKRERVTYWDVSPSAMLHYLLYRPGPNWTDDFNAAAGLDVRRAVVLRRSARPGAGPAQPGLGLAMVAHADPRLLLAGDGVGEVVSAECLAHGLAVPRLGPRGDSLAIPGNARPGIRRRQRAGPMACLATEGTSPAGGGLLRDHRRGLRRSSGISSSRGLSATGPLRRSFRGRRSPTSSTCGTAWATPAPCEATA